MPLPKHLLEELERKREQESVEAAAATRWQLVRTALMCVFWCAVGAVIMGYSFHVYAVTQRQWAIANGAFYLGLIVGTAGPVFTLLSAYRRGVERGDW
jgi:hypothetical protein